MADDDRVEITFTARMDELQRGVNEGVVIIENLTKKIEQINASLGNMGTAKAPDLNAQLEETRTQLESTRVAVAAFSAEMQQLSGSASRSSLDDLFRGIDGADRHMISASASAKTFSTALATQGVTAAETAAQLLGVAGAIQAIGRERVDGVVAGLTRIKSGSDEASISAKTFQAEFDRAARGSVGLWDGFARSVGTAKKEIGVASSEFGRYNQSMLLSAEAATHLEGGTERASHGMNNLGLSTARARRELIVIIHEFTSGNWSRIPNSMIVLAESVGAAHLASAGLIFTLAGVGAVVGAFGYLTYRVVESTYAMDKLKISADFAGNFNVSTEAISRTIRALDWMVDVSVTDAREIVGAFSKIRYMTVESLGALSVATVTYARASGTDFKTATSTIIGLMKDESLTFRQLIDLFPSATAAQIQYTLEVQRTGNIHEIAAAKIDLLRQSNESSTAAIAKADSTMFSSLVNFMTYLGASEQNVDFLTVQNQLIEENTRKLNDQAAAHKKEADAERDRPMTSEETISMGVIAGEKENTGRIQQIETETRIRRIKAAIDELNKTPIQTTESTARLAELSSDLGTANDHLSQIVESRLKKNTATETIAGREGLRLLQEQNAEILAETDLTEAEKRSRVTQSWRIFLSNQEMSSRQYIDNEKNLSKAIRFEIRARSQELIDDARARVSAISADSSTTTPQKLAATTKVWEETAVDPNISANDAIQANKHMHDAIAAQNREAAATEAAIARDKTSTEISLSRIRLDTDRAVLDERVRYGEISADRKIFTLMDFVRREEKLNLDTLDNERSTGEQSLQSFAHIENEKLIIAAQTTKELAKLGRELAIEKQRQAREEVTGWKLAQNEIISAERGLIRGIIGGRQTAQQLLFGFIDELLAKELEADAVYLTKHMMMNASELAADKTSDQAGFLWKMLTRHKEVALDVATETAKTATSVAGETARTATVVTAETVKTAAVVAGETTKTATKMAAAASGSAMELASGSAQIMNSASKAAAGAYAATAGIPIVGPVLAPIAAGVAFAAVAAFNTLTSLDVGAWNVPHDMPAYIHQGESVVPKTFAQGMRENLTANSSTSSSTQSNSSIQLHYSPQIQGSQSKSMDQLLSDQPKAMIRWINGMVRDGHLRIDGRHI